MSAGSPGEDTVAIRGGTVVDATGRRSADVLFGVADGRILAVGSELGGDSALDASGCIVAPGLVDLNTHLRQPGYDEAETIETGARSAALGGFTAVVAMPDTDPAIDCPAMVREVRRMSSDVCCAVHPAAAITVGRKGEKLTSMAALIRLGVRVFTDDGNGVQNAGIMRKALEYASSFEHIVNDRRSNTSGGSSVVLAQHCDLAELSADGCMHEGEWSSRLGLPGKPAEAEEIMAMRDVALARLTGTRVHFQNLSTAGAVEVVRTAKKSGLPVTAEAAPHHFTLTDASCADLEAVFKVNPPLRTDEDVVAVKAGLADGTIDAIATDHAPCTGVDKYLPFIAAPAGVVGLETALALALTELDLPVERILASMSWQPAAIAGISDSQGGPIAPGAAANLCVIDTESKWTVSGAIMASRSSNTPFEGRVLRGRVRHTIAAGEAVVIDGEIQR